jgi:hypothetical protein
MPPTRPRTHPPSFPHPPSLPPSLLPTLSSSHLLSLPSTLPPPTSLPPTLPLPSSPAVPLHPLSPPSIPSHAGAAAGRGQAKRGAAGPPRLPRGPRVQLALPAGRGWPGRPDRGGACGGGGTAAEARPRGSLRCGGCGADARCSAAARWRRSSSPCGGGERELAGCTPSQRLAAARAEARLGEAGV